MTTPRVALARQAAVIVTAMDSLAGAVNRVLGSTSPESATWADVARLAQLVDTIQRAELSTTADNVR